MSRNDSFRKGNKNKTNLSSKNSSSSFQGNGRHERQKQNGFEKKYGLSEEMQKDIAEKEEAIKKFKSSVQVCEICGENINDISSAVSSKKTGNPVHFDCVLELLSKQENLGANDKLTYIGNGKFGILHFENVHDMRHFTIVKEIEWETRDSERGKWRDDMANLYSQVK